MPFVSDIRSQHDGDGHLRAPADGIRTRYILQRRVRDSFVPLFPKVDISLASWPRRVILACADAEIVFFI